MDTHEFVDVNGNPITRGFYQKGKKEEFYLFERSTRAAIGLSPNSPAWKAIDIIDGEQILVGREEAKRYRPANFGVMLDVERKLRQKAEDLDYQARCERERADRLKEYIIEELLPPKRN